MSSSRAVKNNIKQYSSGDMSMYFTGRNSCLPFIDANGQKRVGVTIGMDENQILYKAVLLSKTGITEKTFRKKAASFEDFSYRPKYILVNKKYYYVCPRSVKTVTKAVARETMYAVSMEAEPKDSDGLDYEQVWEYYWGRDHGKDGILITNDMKFTYGVRVK